MSDLESPAKSPANDPPVDDGQEQVYEDAVAAADSDRDSDLLSEIDENQFEDYDPETANIEDRPIDIDEDNARTLKASKRKRADGEVARKPREGRREKKRRDRAGDDVMDDADEDEGGAAPTRRSRRAGDGERRARAKPSSPAPQPEEELTPEERRKREIDRQLDAAIKKPNSNRRKRKDEIVSTPSGFVRANVRFDADTWNRIFKTRLTNSSPSSVTRWIGLARATTMLANRDNPLYTSSSCCPKSPLS